MIRKVLAILCAASSVAFVGIWGLSYVRAMSVDWRGSRSRTWIASDYGSIHISHTGNQQMISSKRPTVRLYSQSWGREVFGWRGLYLFDFVVSGSSGHLLFPAWVPVCAFGFAGWLLARPSIREWRRRSAGLCGGCGYDLTGNTSGRCPECGEKAS